MDETDDSAESWKKYLPKHFSFKSGEDPVEYEAPVKIDPIPYYTPPIETLKFVNIPVPNALENQSPVIGPAYGVLRVGEVHTFGGSITDGFGSTVGHMDIFRRVYGPMGETTGLAADACGIIRPILPPQIPFGQPG